MKLIILVLVGGYVLVCALAYVFQHKLVYFPERDITGTPNDAGMDFSDVSFQRADGKALHGWLIPAPDARFTILFCHGNAGNISGRLESIRLFHDLGLSVFIFDYAGYGQSQGRPSEYGTYRDARAAWEYLTRERKVRPRDIILFGRSLGGAVAIELATHVNPGALIAESCFTSAVELGARVYPWLPVRFLARARYDSASRVGEIVIPKLFVHSLEDEVVPYGMGRRLFNRAAKPKTMLKIRGGHNDGFLVSNDKYVRELGEFIATLDESRAGS